MYNISTQVHTLAGETVKAVFEDDEDGFISFSGSNMHGDDIRVAVTPKWDDTASYRVACSVGDETLSLQRYGGDSEEPDVVDDDGWEEIDTIVKFELNPEDPPEALPDDADL